MKKNKRLILHIGTVKTGTSSIQESLGRARDVLLKHNIYYPGIRPYNHIFTFTPIFVEDPGKIAWFRQKMQQLENGNIKIQGFRKDWLKEFTSCSSNHNFIISAEHLTVPLFDEDAVKRLKGFIEPYFEEVTIVAYVRHYNSWIAAEVQQKVRNGFTAGSSLAQIVGKMLNCPPIMSYRESLQKWVNVFGREAMVVRSFDPESFYNHSLLADFFHACNLPADDIRIPEIRSNESIGRHAVAFLQKYNQTYPIFINGSINLERGLARWNVPTDLYKNLADEKFRLEMVYSSEQARTFNQEIDYVNQFFADGYQFEHVLSGEGETQVPSAEDIPVEFFVELINNYNKRIESHRIRIEKQEEQLASLWKHKAYLQKFVDLLKIPLFMRALDRLPWVKTRLQKITNRQKMSTYA